MEEFNIYIFSAFSVFCIYFNERQGLTHVKIETGSNNANMCIKSSHKFNSIK